MTPPLIVCMGVSGTGKSTCARSLATNFDLPFIEADDLHTSSNKEKMRTGLALTDGDREPWMRAVCERLSKNAGDGIGCILAHSALRRAHRERLRSCGLRTLFLHLDGSRETIARRLGERDDHFMPATLLDSQFSALQSISEESDVVALNTALDIEELMFHATSVANEFMSRGMTHALSSVR